MNDNFFLYRFLGKKISKQDTASINNLLKQLSTLASALSVDQLEEILDQSNAFILVCLIPNGRIVGMAGLFYRLSLTERKGFIGDVVVDSEWQGLGIARTMTNILIKMAKLKNLKEIRLTSNPSRVAANNLYLKLGFEFLGNLNGTNHYRLKL